MPGRRREVGPEHREWACRSAPRAASLVPAPGRATGGGLCLLRSVLRSFRRRVSGASRSSSARRCDGASGLQNYSGGGALKAVLLASVRACVRARSTLRPPRRLWPFQRGAPQPSPARAPESGASGLVPAAERRRLRAGRGLRPRPGAGALLGVRACCRGPRERSAAQSLDCGEFRGAPGGPL